MPADLGNRDAEIDRRIEDARAVEMQTQCFRSSELARTREVVERQHFAGLGILQAQQAGLGKMRIVGLDRGLDVGEIERSIRLVVERLRLDATEHGRASAFELVGVGLLSDDVLVAALTMGHQREQIALRAAGHTKHPGHTELLADLTGTPEVSMLLMTPWCDTVSMLTVSLGRTRATGARPSGISPHATVSGVDRTCISAGCGIEVQPARHSTSAMRDFIWRRPPIFLPV